MRTRLEGSRLICSGYIAHLLMLHVEGKGKLKEVHTLREVKKAPLVDVAVALPE